jgi:hypothetical protein
MHLVPPNLIVNLRLNQVKDTAGQSDAAFPAVLQVRVIWL